MVFSCSGFTDAQMEEIADWADALGADMVRQWSNSVTHLIVKCVYADNSSNEACGNAKVQSPGTGDAATPLGKRKLFSDDKQEKKSLWVKIRSLKYLKALAAGRWIVSEDWLRGASAVAIQ